MVLILVVDRRVAEGPSVNSSGGCQFDQRLGEQAFDRNLRQAADEIRNLLIGHYWLPARTPCFVSMGP